ncbi:AAA family ATPase [Mycolicibacterium septicum]|uniref:ATP-binding protein n=1 Tax=Mycolicibacterium septicum TaxID=98668 RepID=UPI0023E34A7F|nr:AAA family ATPase [Mycolicibacterium septicum]MDF3337893.1 AAA family ATPase [Mycolicibacterium septicum]
MPLQSDLRFHVANKALVRRFSVTLVPNNWDDSGYRTLFDVEFFDEHAKRHPIGAVKIGEYGLKNAPQGSNPKSSPGRPTLPDTFAVLDRNTHFSVGQDTSYYEAINRLDADYAGFRQDYLSAMNDMAFRKATRTRAMQEPVTETSLLRTLSWKAVRDQFARLARGGASVTAYKLTLPIRDELGAQQLVCTVRPKAMPPENIRILIGRNGSGKTTTLRDLAKMLIERSEHSEIEDVIKRQRDQLANLVSVSFSAFDPFEPIETRQSLDGIKYRYIGLKTYDPFPNQLTSNKTDEFEDGHRPDKRSENPVVELGRDDHSRWRPMTVPELDAHAVTAVHNCVGIRAQRQRLVKALTLFEADLNFASFGIRDMVARAGPNDDIRRRLQPLVEIMSAGHKIAMLTISQLVVTVQEKTLVLIDEPEAHLHPPLLSAFVRALSGLLTDRNGLAIIATHSPVVLQEAPRSCVRIVENLFSEVTLREPQLETFGENVGTLTGEVFGLEVTSTGYHALLQEVADQHTTYEAALRAFDGQLGGEGRAILRAMISANSRSRDVGY